MAVGGHGEKSRQWDLAISALLSCPTVRQAADIAGVSENTMLRFMQNDEFMEKYKAAKQLVLSAAITRLQAITGEAVEALREVLSDKEAPASARVSAARAVLELSAKYTENEEIVSRLEALEALIEKRVAS